MSTPLKDFRLAVSEQVLAALEAEATAYDRDMAAIARDVLSDWAKRKHRAHTLYAKRFLANGPQADFAWEMTEENGRGRK